LVGQDANGSWIMDDCRRAGIDTTRPIADAALPRTDHPVIHCTDGAIAADAQGKVPSNCPSASPPEAQAQATPSPLATCSVSTQTGRRSEACHSPSAPPLLA